MKRVSGPAVDEITTIGQFVQLRHAETPFFVYYGDENQVTTKYDVYRTLADELQEKCYFKFIQKTEFLPKDMKEDEMFVKDSVAVVKGPTYWRFEDSTGVCAKEDTQDDCVDLLASWMRRERLPNFIEVTSESFYDVQNNGGA